MMHEYGLFGGGWMMIVWWILIIAVIVIGIRFLMNATNGRSDQSDTPLDVLKKRYARGEIDKEEFEKRKKELL